jgi:agmatine deiminase
MLARETPKVKMIKPLILNPELKRKLMGEASSPLYMPAEWERHEATILAWPYREEDWSQKFLLISWLYAEIVRVLSRHEPLEILCFNEQMCQGVTEILTAVGVNPSSYRLHVAEYAYVWLRDTAPTGVFDSTAKLSWVHWGFNGWARLPGVTSDGNSASLISRLSAAPLLQAERQDGQGEFVIEGGAFDSDGEGTLLVTQDCLLSRDCQRNPGFSKEDYEETLKRYLGVEKIIWLRSSCYGDKTSGHVDQTARFVAPGKILLSHTTDKSHPSYGASCENIERLASACDAKERAFEVHLLPIPQPIIFDGHQAPASYANFYIANGVVLVPTFNDPSDGQALEIISRAFPDRKTVGIYSRELSIAGGGSIHCVTQQWPACCHKR